MAFAQPPDPNTSRTIAHVGGDLYRAQDGNQTTVFLVTPEGILLADSLNVTFARWLRDELEKTFPGRPVKYVVYTGVDFDRVRGGWVFKPSARLIAHAEFDERLAEAGRVLPPRYAGYDQDTNGILARSEIETAIDSSSILSLDRNADGQITAGELWSEATSPDDTYASRRSIVLGGKHVELVHSGPTRDGTAILFRDERILFVAHSPTAPFADRSVRPSDVARWADTIGNLEFDTLLAGNGAVLPRADIALVADYVRSLLRGVAAGYEAGQSLEEIQRGPAIDSFAGTPFALMRDADIASLYQRTRVVVVDVYGAALANHIRVTPDPAVCGRSLICDAGTTSGLGTSTGLGVSIKRYRLAVEMSIGSQLDVSFVDQSSGNRQISRETYVSVLGGYRSAPSGTFSVTLLAGPTLTYVRAATRMQATRFAISPYSSARSGLAFTFGADISAPLGRGFGIVVPVRLTKSTREELLQPIFRPGLDIRAGMGVTFALGRRAT
jgi:glyoxylase-like metal-dependent hydrolase (beta-lactamase superfamily II)